MAGHARRAGAAEWDHKAIVAYLAAEHAGSTTAWWRQSLAVGYEQARGKRAVGETADAGFQVGVQRTLDTLGRRGVGAPHLAARALARRRRPDRASSPGERYEAPAAAERCAWPGPATRLRLTWQPKDWAAPATLQLTVHESRPGKTVLGAHLEKLPDAEAREEMRSHWRATLERIAHETERTART